MNNLNTNNIDDNDWTVPSEVTFRSHSFFLNYESESLLWGAYLKQSPNLSKEDKKLLD